MKMYIALIILVIIFLGCEGPPGPIGPTGPTGPSLSGSIEGYAMLYQDYNFAYKNKSGIKVSLEETGASTVTDSTGWWRLDNVKSGTYTIVYEKVGFFTKRLFGVQFVGGGTFYIDDLYYTPSLYEIPLFTIDSIHYSLYQDYILIKGKISDAADYHRYVIVQVDTSRSINKNRFSPLLHITVFSDTSSFSQLIPFQLFLSKRNQWVYFKAYPGTNISDYSWDPRTRTNTVSYVSDQATALDSIYIP